MPPAKSSPRTSASSRSRCFTRLFRDDGTKIEDRRDAAKIPPGPPISPSALLVRNDVTAEIFFVDDGVKQWITSDEAKKKNALLDPTVSKSTAELDAFRNGPNMDC